MDATYNLTMNSIFATMLIMEVGFVDKVIPTFPVLFLFFPWNFELKS